MSACNDKVTIGFFSIGLEVYWAQFPGLRERLLGHTAAIAQKLERLDVRVVNLGMIDSPEKALEAGHELRRSDVDLVFLYPAT
jgi:L-arabinose isomerase